MTQAELQTEELGTDEIGEELATSEAGEETQAPEGFIKAEDAQKDINKQHRKYRDEERARKKIQAEAETLRKELEVLREKSVDVSVPPIPDRYDDDYEQKLKVRDEAIERKTLHQAEISNRENQQTRVEEARQRDEQSAMEAKIQSFDANMVQIGLNPLEVKKAADTLVDYGVSDQLQDILLEDTDGPLLVKYLADNPIELESVNGMSTLQIVNYLNGEARQKASLLRPQTSRAPNPPVTLKGGGVKEMEEPLLRGAKFE